MPRSGSSALDMVLRVPKLTSFSMIVRIRSSETSLTILTIFGLIDFSSALVNSTEQASIAIAQKTRLLNFIENQDSVLASILLVTLRAVSARELNSLRAIRRQSQLQLRGRLPPRSPPRRSGNRHPATASAQAPRMPLRAGFPSAPPRPPTPG